MKGATKYRLIASLAPWLSLLLLNVSCSNSLFKVKPASTFPPLSASAASANVGVVTFRAAPLLTDEETQQLFESNLQLAGLLPIRLEVIHHGGDPIEFKKLRFRLHDASNSNWRLISAQAAISRILKANDVFAYNPNSRKTFEKEFRAYEFDLKTPFASTETKRRGILIFQTAKQEPVASPKELTLTIEGLAQPISLKLN
jgi:hypothetical protein